MAKVVILGAGIGGLPAAFEMRAALPREHTVTVVNANEDFQFVPSNPWVAVGWRTRKTMTMPLAPALARKNIEFLARTVARIDPGAKKLSCSDGSEIPYDYLVITTGPKLAFDEIPGAGPGGHTHSICTTEHAELAYEGYRRFLDDYIGHLGLGGVGDSKGLLESEMRDHHIKWITNAKVLRAEPGKLIVAEHNDRGEVIKEHELASKYSMILPAFKGVDAVAQVEGLCNPRGFVIVDQNQRSPKYPSIYSAGVCIAIPPVEATPVPTGAPKTGYMIESMVTAIVKNISDEIAGRKPEAKGTWNAICLADMGDTGAAFVALPQIPPRNVTWSKKGKWVHWSKIAFEKYFLYKMRHGASEPFIEKYMLRVLGINRLKQAA